jgi:hypothetical protein
MLPVRYGLDFLNSVSNNCRFQLPQLAVGSRGKHLAANSTVRTRSISLGVRGEVGQTTRHALNVSLGRNKQQGNYTAQIGNCYIAGVVVTASRIIFFAADVSRAQCSECRATIIK